MKSKQAASACRHASAQKNQIPNIDNAMKRLSRASEIAALMKPTASDNPITSAAPAQSAGRHGADRKR